MKKCNICGVETQDTELSPTLDCGGDCLSCMAEAGDPTALESMYRFLKEENRNLRIQRDELLEALKRILPQYEALLRDCGLASEHTTDQARAAIACVEKAKDGKQ